MVILMSCDEETELAPTDKYLKIYDDRSYNNTYKPISMIDTETGGTLVLTERSLQNSNFAGCSIIRIDSIGDITSTVEVPDNIVAPVGGLLQMGSSYFFIAMDENSLLTQLVPVNEDGSVGTPNVIGLRYPLAASVTSDGNLLVLSYDSDDRRSIISIIGSDGSVQRAQGYSVGAANDIEPIIFDHFTNPDARLTFFTGETDDGRFYFNGFYNFTLSLVFTNFGVEPTGVVQGQQTFTGIRSLLHLNTDQYTVMGYQFDRNFLLPQATIRSDEITSSVDLFLGATPEVRPGAPSKSIALRQPGGDLLVVTATETQNRQTILYFHDETGQLKGIELLGSLNPFTFGDLVATNDGGLKVMGTTFLASRFERVYLALIPASEINDIVQ